MFDTVLDRGNIPPRYIPAAFGIAVAAHVLMIALAIYISKRPHDTKKADVDVKFMQAAPPPPPPPPPPAGGNSNPRPHVEKPHPVKKPDVMVESKDKEKPKEQPQEQKSDNSAAGQPGGQVGGVEGGVAGGVVGGVVGGVLGGVLGGTGTGTVAPPAPQNQVYTFGQGMTRPQLSSGLPQMPRDAREAKVEGTMLLKCVITKAGKAQGCSILKGLPFMDDVVMKWIQTASFTPVTLNGAPIDCSVTVPLRFKMQ
jgi:periplasmic protein TonB